MREAEQRALVAAYQFLERVEVAFTGSDDQGRLVELSGDGDLPTPGVA